VSVPSPGTVVAWWEHDVIAFGVLVAEEKARVVLVAADGREERVAATRVVAALSTGPVPARTQEGRREAAATATAMAESIASTSASVDVPTLWELAKDMTGPIDEATLAGLALAREDAPARLATVLALSRDGVHFVRKPAGWLPRDDESVRAIVEEREQVAARKAERARAFEALTSAWRGGAFTPSGSAVERRILLALESFAVSDLEAPEKERQMAAEALDAAGARGDRPSEAAFRLLRRTGRFASDDENLAIVRFSLRTAFSEEVAAAAEAAAAAGWARGARDRR
jgi:hypothetical protein